MRSNSGLKLANAFGVDVGYYSYLIDWKLANQPERGAAPSFLIANHADLPAPERPLLRFPPHTAAVKFAVAASGDLFVALFGDEVPMTAPSGPKVGRSVMRVDASDWTMHPFVQEALLRPIDVRFSADGALYILDFGGFEMLAQGGVSAEANTGKVWRVSGVA